MQFCDFFIPKRGRHLFFHRKTILVLHAFLLSADFFRNQLFRKILSRIPIPGRVAQSVTCLATDACLTADPGAASSILARYHTFVEINHEIISTVILLPSADLFKKGCCQLQANVCAQITG